MILYNFFEDIEVSEKELIVYCKILNNEKNENDNNKNIGNEKK